MKPLQILTIASIVALFATSVLGQEVPNYLKDTYPKHALKSAVEARKVLTGKDARLDAKTRALISLGVSAQISCTYCVCVNTKNAVAAGASEDEIREAVAIAAQLRLWSTVLNGMAYDLEAFKAEVDEIHSAK